MQLGSLNRTNLLFRNLPYDLILDSSYLFGLLLLAKDSQPNIKECHHLTDWLVCPVSQTLQNVNDQLKDGSRTTMNNQPNSLLQDLNIQLTSPWPSR